MEDKVRKMQLLKDNEKKELVSTLQNGEFPFSVLLTVRVRVRVRVCVCVCDCAFDKVYFLFYLQCVCDQVWERKVME
jgi:hypothetical protein